MHKKMSAAIIGLCMVLAFSGCGKVSTTQKRTLEDFQKIAKAPSVYFSAFKKFISLTDLSTLVLTPDADPDVTTERHTAETTAKTEKGKRRNDAARDHRRHLRSGARGTYPSGAGRQGASLAG